MIRVNKKLLTLSIALFGLVLLEWGCNQNEGRACKTRIVEFLGIQEVTTIQYTEDNLWVEYDLDTISYNQILFNVLFSSREVVMVNDRPNSFALYATPPCPPPILHVEIDSVKIWRIGSDTTDATDAFSVNGMKIDNNDTFRFHNRLNQTSGSPSYALAIETPPDSVESGIYLFSFHMEDGSLFEATSPQVIVSP